jgi:hypothetical protein
VGSRKTLSSVRPVFSSTAADALADVFWAIDVWMPNPKRNTKLNSDFLMLVNDFMH